MGTSPVLLGRLYGAESKLRPGLPPPAPFPLRDPYVVTQAIAIGLTPEFCCICFPLESIRR